MPAHTLVWLLKQVHLHHLYLHDANSEIFLPNQIAAPAATIQAFINGTIGVCLPSRECWIQAYSDDTEMGTIRDLVLNPSKINLSTLNVVNFNYRAPLWQSQIVIEDGLLIYWEPMHGGSSYTCLQLVPSEFYNIIFVTFHSNATGGQLNAYRTLHHICLQYYWPVCTPTSNVCAMPAPVVPLQTQPRASPLNWSSIFPSKHLSSSYLLVPTLLVSTLALLVLRCIWLRAVV
jgi:hypothetical protein